MPKRRTWLITGSASILAPPDQDQVNMYVAPGRMVGPTPQQQQRLSDRLEGLVREAMRGPDKDAARQLQHILAGVRQRSRRYAGHERRAPEAALPTGA